MLQKEKEMKILWVVNLMLPDIADSLGKNASQREGWLSGIFAMMRQLKDNAYTLSVAYPTMDASISMVTLDGIDCYPFRENLSQPERYDVSLEKNLEDIIDKVNPDILHIFGTEFPHALAAARVFNRPEATLVGIQGVCSLIAKDYMALLPSRVVNKVTFRDFLKKDSLKKQQEKFIKRGENEKELLRLAGYITGRTGFDERVASALNPGAVYLKMNETMREVFYEDSWDLKKTHGHCVFLGQGDYPIKGMHFLIEALGKLREKYPDLCMCIAGNSIINADSVKDIIKTSAYGGYLRGLIAQNGLEGHVKVLGMLDAQGMKKAYLSCDVFVCASYIENSPNTVAEAMLLGVPVVASDAGGITSVISKEEGFIFKRGDVKMLASAIDRVWTLEKSRSHELEEMLERAKERAHRDYDKETNARRLFEIYDRIYG